MKTYTGKTLAVVLFVALLSVFDCGGGDRPEPKVYPDYPGWTTFGGNQFVFHYRADVPWADRVQSFPEGFRMIMEHDCRFLRIEVPEDTIHVYIYNSEEEAEELSRYSLPYVAGNQIHYDQSTTGYGMGLTMYLLLNSDYGRPRYDFLYEGLATFRDYTHNDYVVLAANNIGGDKDIPLDTLIDNDAYNRANKMSRRIRAASLVAFFVVDYGVPSLKMLWHSDKPFEKAISDLFALDKATLEEKWSDFMIQNLKAKHAADNEDK